MASGFGWVLNRCLGLFAFSHAATPDIAKMLPGNATSTGSFIRAFCNASASIRYDNALS